MEDKLKRPIQMNLEDDGITVFENSDFANRLAQELEALYKDHNQKKKVLDKETFKALKKVRKKLKNNPSSSVPD